MRRSSSYHIVASTTHRSSFVVPIVGPARTSQAECCQAWHDRQGRGGVAEGWRTAKGSKLTSREMDIKSGYELWHPHYSQTLTGPTDDEAQERGIRSNQVRLSCALQVQGTQVQAP